jgi:hypothetical protein
VRDPEKGQTADLVEAPVEEFDDAEQPDDAETSHH